MSSYLNDDEMEKNGFSHFKCHIVRHTKGERVITKDERGRFRWSSALEDDAFSVHEIYYSKDGKARAVTETPIYYAYFDTVDQLKDGLQTVLDALNKNDVLDFKTIGVYTNEPDK